MPPRTPETLKVRAAWRRRHHHDSWTPDAAGLRGLPPLPNLTFPARSPARTSLTRGPSWGRQEVSTQVHRTPPPSSHFREG